MVLARCRLFGKLAIMLLNICCTRVILNCESGGTVRDEKGGEGEGRGRDEKEMIQVTKRRGWGMGKN